MSDNAIISPVLLGSGDAYTTQAELIYPGRPGKYPLLAFSTGAFSHPNRYHKLLKPLASAGYVIAAPVHQDYEGNTAEPKPSRDEVWRTRNLDIARCLAGGDTYAEPLARHGVSVAGLKTGVIGHSYGALIAQLAAGARAIDPAGGRPDRRIQTVSAMVALSPPGPFPGSTDAQAWSTIAVPSFSLTGTTDVLPGFIDEWQLHKAPYEATPEGTRSLWVGDEVDHYFNGVYGREKDFDDRTESLFNQALADMIAFLDHNLKGMEYPLLSEPAGGYTLTVDTP